MPRLPTLTPQKLIRILKRNGFILVRSKGSHHLFFNPVTKRRVIVAFHRKDLPKGTLMEILRSAGITKDEILKVK